MPMTSGILIGIGETAAERIEALFALRDVHLAHAHLQEVIVQNFCPKPGTKMAGWPEVAQDDLLRVLAAAFLSYLSARRPASLHLPYVLPRRQLRHLC